MTCTSAFVHVIASPTNARVPSCSCHAYLRGSVPAFMGFQEKRRSRLAPASNVTAHWSASPLSAITSVLHIRHTCRMLTFIV